MRLAAAPALPQPGRQEPPAEGLRADRQPFLGQLLTGEGGAEVGVTLAVGRQDLRDEGGVGLAVGRPAAQAVDDGGIAAGLQAALEAADLAGAEAQQAGGLGLGAVAVADEMENLEDIAFTLTHRDPVLGKHAGRHGSSLA